MSVTCARMGPSFDIPALCAELSFFVLLPVFAHLCFYPLAPLIRLMHIISDNCYQLKLFRSLINVTFLVVPFYLY